MRLARHLTWISFAATHASGFCSHTSGSERDCRRRIYRPNNLDLIGKRLDRFSASGTRAYLYDLSQEGQSPAH